MDAVGSYLTVHRALESLKHKDGICLGEVCNPRWEFESDSECESAYEDEEEEEFDDEDTECSDEHDKKQPKLATPPAESVEAIAAALRCIVASSVFEVHGSLSIPKSCELLADVPRDFEFPHPYYGSAEPIPPFAPACNAAAGGAALKLQVTPNMLAATEARDALLGRCKESPFGDLREQVTRVDARVRKAVECNFWWPQGSLLKAIDEDIHEALLARVSKSGWTYELQMLPYKLNVYQEGGFFAPHVDTPRHPHMAGTLVVCLPSAFEGGELVLRHQGQETTLNWAAQAASRLQWAAFFGDVQHEVLPVRAGLRVTLTYVLIPKLSSWRSEPLLSDESEAEAQSDAGSKTDSDQEGEEAVAEAGPKTESDQEGDETEEETDKESEIASLRSSPVKLTDVSCTKTEEEQGQEQAQAQEQQKLPASAAAALVSNLAQLLNDGSGHPVGLFTLHRYTRMASDAGLLRGKDAPLFALLQQHFDVRLVSVACLRQEQRARGDDTREVFHSMKVFQFDAAALKLLRAGSGSGRSSQAAAAVCKNCRFILPDPVVPGYTLAAAYVAGADYTGNESMDDEDMGMYFSLAMICSRKSTQ